MKRIALALAPAALADQPPVLDPELFFGNPEIAAARLSPDGTHVAFLEPWKEARNVWVKKTAESYSADTAGGTFSMGGQARPVAVDLGGALFADGAGAHDVVARQQ